MSTISADNVRKGLTPDIQILIALGVAIVGYFLGYNAGINASRDTMGEEVRRIARDKEANTTLITGKKGGVNAVDILSGKHVPPCDERTPDQPQCEFDVKVIDGKPVLIRKKDQQPIPRDKILAEDEIHMWIHRGSHCTSSSSGGKVTTNCCHSSSCW
jgi:hypothetical protein